MKLVTLILATILLVLATKPCSDGYNTEDLVLGATTEHNHQEDTDDSCSFACICFCCGITITYQPIPYYTLQHKTLISTEVLTEYNTNYQYNFLFSIWHPPKFIS